MTLHLTDEDRAAWQRYEKENRRALMASPSNRPVRERQTNCRFGHSMKDAYVRSDGRRECRVCRKATSDKWRNRGKR